MLLIEPVSISESEERITTIGWERNKKNQLHPRIVDMSSSMNTEKLAESAVNLNLKVKCFVLFLINDETMDQHIKHCQNRMNRIKRRKTNFFL